MQKCNYGALLAQWRCVVTSTSYYRCFVSLLFLRFFSFSFSYLSSSALVHLLFFLYSSTSFSLPHLTSLPLKNLLRKLLTEERLDRREAWSVAGGALSLRTLWFLFLLYFFSLLKKAEGWKLWFFCLMGLKWGQD